jgi:hypothetical protein
VKEAQETTKKGTLFCARNRKNTGNGLIRVFDLIEEDVTVKAVNSLAEKQEKP